MSGLPYWRSWRPISVADRVDCRERDVVLVLLQILQLRTASAPAAGAGSVHAHRAAHAIVGIAGVGENALVLPDGGAGTIATQFENRAGGFIRFGGEHRADGASAHAGHSVAVLDGVGEDLTDLIDGRDLAFGVLLQGDVDGVALMNRHVARRGGQLAIGPNAAPVDDCVEDLDIVARSAISGLSLGCCQIAREVRTSCAQYAISRASFSASNIQCRAVLSSPLRGLRG